MKRRGSSFTVIFQLPKRPHQETHAVLLKHIFKPLKAKYSNFQAFFLVFIKKKPLKRVEHKKKGERGKKG